MYIFRKKSLTGNLNGDLNFDWKFLKLKIYIFNAILFNFQNCDTKIFVKAYNLKYGYLQFCGGLRGPKKVQKVIFL